MLFLFCGKRRLLLLILSQNLQKSYALKAEKNAPFWAICWMFPDGKATKALTSPKAYFWPAGVF